jgi:hypothetical protein
VRQQAVPLRQRWVIPLVAALALLTGLFFAGLFFAGDHAIAKAPKPPKTETAMVCQKEAEDEITEALGLPPSQALTSTWADQLFTCTYHYNDAVMLVSVKQLADPTSARKYFTGQQAAASNSTPFPDMGDAAFIINAGSTYVLKGAFVLHVDVSKMPDTLGPKKVPRNHVGIAVSAVILGCWVDG